MNKYLFSGDTLLINGTGRTDFQNGNSKDAYNSIFNRLLKLPEDTILYPGHDYNGKRFSTIGNEKKFNPRLQVKNADEYAELMSNLNLAKPKLIDINIVMTPTINIVPCMASVQATLLIPPRVS